MLIRKEITIVTGNNGDFSIELPEGQYTFTIRQKGYSTTILDDVIVKIVERLTRFLLVLAQ